MCRFEDEPFREHRWRPQKFVAVVEVDKPRRFRAQLKSHDGAVKEVGVQAPEDPLANPDAMYAVRRASAALR